MTPIYQIKANGTNITELLQKEGTAISVTDNAGVTADELNITVTSAVEIPDTGAELEVRFGYKETKTWPMGTFAVSAISISKTNIVIKAKAMNQSKQNTPTSIDKEKATKAAAKTALKVAAESQGLDSELVDTADQATQNNPRSSDAIQPLKNTLTSSKERSWSKKTITEIVTTIAQESGYQPIIAPAFAETTIEHIDQTNESDINLLSRIGKIYSAMAKPAGKKLLFVPEGAAKSATGKSLPLVKLEESDLAPNWKVDIEDRKAYKTIEATYRDKALAEDKTVTVGSGSEPLRKLGQTFESPEQAQKAAEGAFKKAQQGRQKLSCTIAGREIFAETPLEINFEKSLINRSWIADKAIHTINQSGYKVAITGSMQA